jgi:hypothetical protein
MAYPPCHPPLSPPPSCRSGVLQKVLQQWINTLQPLGWMTKAGDGVDDGPRAEGRVDGTSLSDFRVARVRAGRAPIKMLIRWGITHRALGIGHWAPGTGHWALGTGHWALGTGHWARQLDQWRIRFKL